ncbi:S41 family peptidase [Streptomyces pathocidini]|uniref:S41 family peptidase n=1 Tax=Streptomyces pathocidini TaxID=1650571 RepID=UPI00341063C6
MSGPSMFVRPRSIRRGAALTFVFATVLGTGAAAGAFGDEMHNTTDATASSLPKTGTADRDEVAAAAREAMAKGQSGSKAAEEVVSRSGDRWSAVYSAREYENVRQALDGEYVGVGLWVRCRPGGRIEVARVQPSSPADRAGIAVGDRLRTIDGEPMTGQPVTEVVSRLRGGNPAAANGNEAEGQAGGTQAGSGDDKPPDRSAAAGTPVRLGLERDGRTWQQTLHRTRLATEAVTADRSAADRATRIKVDSFSKGSGEQVRRAVREAPEGDGILLDLRGNSGGLVTEAVTAASAFLDGGLVATYDVKGRQRALYAQEGGDVGTPLVVLVDGGTMSAAELLTGALQDRGRAVVVGSRTFGKGSVQMPSKLPDGSVAELTVGHYKTPAGRSVDGEGIAPDLAVKGGAEERARTVLSGLGGGA